MNFSKLYKLIARHSKSFFVVGCIIALVFSISFVSKQDFFKTSILAAVHADFDYEDIPSGGAVVGSDPSSAGDFSGGYYSSGDESYSSSDSDAGSYSGSGVVGSDPSSSGSTPGSASSGDSSGVAGSDPSSAGSAPGAPSSAVSSGVTGSDPSSAGSPGTGVVGFDPSSGSVAGSDSSSGGVAGADPSSGAVVGFDPSSGSVVGADPSSGTVVGLDPSTPVAPPAPPVAPPVTPPAEGAVVADLTPPPAPPAPPGGGDVAPPAGPGGGFAGGGGAGGIFRPGGGAGTLADMGSGSAGGRGGPKIVLKKATREELSSFVYLSQIPYTGIGGTLVTIIFILMLMGMSALLAYLIVYWNELKGRWVQAFAGNPVFGSQFAFVSTFPSALTYSGVSGTEEDMETFPSPLEESDVRNREVYLDELENKKNPAPSKRESSTSASSASENLSPEILEGLSHVSTHVTSNDKPVVQNNGLRPMPSTQEAAMMSQALEEAARAQEVLLESEGIDLIMIAADGNQGNALSILNQLISVGREWRPAIQDGWLLLGSDTIRDILFSTYISMIPIFVRWLAEGDHTKAFSFIRMLSYQGHSLSDYLRYVIYELDKAHRFRSERMPGADQQILDLTASWKRHLLEDVIAALISGVDERYKATDVAGKLAVSKAFEVMRSNREGDKLPLSYSI